MRERLELINQLRAEKQYILDCREADRERIATLIALNAEMLMALQVVLQHGRIDDSESRMNMVAQAIAKARGLQP